MDYTPQEVMVAAAAREIRDGEIVFTGMRLPLIAFALAKQTHAPNAVGLFECGLARDTPAPELLYTMGDPPNIAGALWATRMINMMGLLQRGEVDLGFIGGAELDRFGNLNTSYLGSPESPRMKLPGSGGAADIAGLSRRFVVIMAHEKRRLVERVDYITSPGFGDGPGWREQVGLRGGGPSAIITTRCVFGFEESKGLSRNNGCVKALGFGSDLSDPIEQNHRNSSAISRILRLRSGQRRSEDEMHERNRYSVTDPKEEAVLRSYHPGQSVASVQAETGWDLRVAKDVHETEPPTAEELALIRRYDPQGFWTR